MHYVLYCRTNYGQYYQFTNDRHVASHGKENARKYVICSIKANGITRNSHGNGQTIIASYMNHPAK